MTSFTQIFHTKSILQDAINCWLQYALAQPIEIDIRILGLFILQYLGITQLSEWIDKAKPSIMNALKFQFNEVILERV